MHDSRCKILSQYHWRDTLGRQCPPWGLGRGIGNSVIHKQRPKDNQTNKRVKVCSSVRSKDDENKEHKFLKQAVKCIIFKRQVHLFTTFWAPLLNSWPSGLARGSAHLAIGLASISTIDNYQMRACLNSIIRKLNPPIPFWPCITIDNHMG